MGATAGSADLQIPITEANATSGLAQTNQALQQQQNFLQALQAQHGIQNQSNVFNQLQGVANGTGPNPAQAQLAQATGANVANQAALMAGQRGSSSNAGLIARQAGQAGAGIQQNAVGQAATLQANQSLNALNSLGSLANNQVANQAAATGAVTSAKSTQEQTLLNAIAQQNNARVGNQSSMNSANAAIQGANAQAQGNLLGGITGGIGSALGLAKGGMVPHDKLSMYPDGGMVVPLSGEYQDAGNVDMFANANAPSPMSPPVEAPMTPSTPAIAPLESTPAASTGPRSGFGKFMQGMNKPASGLSGTALAGNTVGRAIGDGLKALFSSKPSTNAPAPMSSNVMQAPQMMTTGLAKGGKVPAMVSPGEVYLPPKDVKKVEKGKNPLQIGERIPGKAKVKGDSYANDTVSRDLETGGVVIPKSIMESKDPAKKAAAFVRAVLAKKK